MSPANRRPAAVVREEFNKLVDEAAEYGVRPKCHGNPGPYQDFEEGDEPTRWEAEDLCFRCPFMAACEELAVVEKGYGVWAGKLYERGRVVRFANPKTRQKKFA